MRTRRPAVWAAAVAAAALLWSPPVVGAARASTSGALTGTYTEMFNPTNIEVRGGYTIITVHNTGSFAGSLSGPTEVNGTAIVRPDGTTTLIASGVCQCTFAGRSGRVRFDARTTVTPEGFASGHATFVGASGGLSGLTGSARYQGFGTSVNLSGRLVLP